MRSVKKENGALPSLLLLLLLLSLTLLLSLSLKLSLSLLTLRLEGRRRIVVESVTHRGQCSTVRSDRSCRRRITIVALVLFFAVLAVNAVVVGALSTTTIRGRW